MYCPTSKGVLKANEIENSSRGSCCQGDALAYPLITLLGESTNKHSASNTMLRVCAYRATHNLGRAQMQCVRRLSVRKPNRVAGSVASIAGLLYVGTAALVEYAPFVDKQLGAYVPFAQTVLGPARTALRTGAPLSAVCVRALQIVDLRSGSPHERATGFKEAA
jgi:hypothetical protein